MTRAEWDALTPREKDAIVAERVMGFVVETVPRVLKCDPPNTYWKRPNGSLIYGEFAPTASWDTMREVVERMLGLDFGVVIDGGSYDHTHTFGWECEFRPHGIARELASADTLPEAVCIAALTALGHMEIA